MEASQGQRDVKDANTTLGNGMQASCGTKNHSSLRMPVAIVDNCSVRSVSSEDVSYGAGVRRQCCGKAANPAYKTGRRLQLLQMLVLPFIPILALIMQTSITLRDILVYRQEVAEIDLQVQWL
uniref:(California timema) hypothetical protein n=1 Tax=Timema californicum TaxID=61474 RepID=A0A7R9JJF8_TIMCA|nr:unnamed protein product [Timema californicum]